MNIQKTSFIYCYCCAHKVHEMAISCPKCGAVMNKEPAKKPGVAWSIIPLLTSIGLIPTCSYCITGLIAWKLDNIIWGLSLYVLLLAISVILAIYNLCHNRVGTPLNIIALVLVNLQLWPTFIIVSVMSALS